MSENIDKKWNIESIKRISVKNGDVLHFEVEVGKLTSSKANEWTADIQKTLKGIFPKNRCIVTTIRNGRPDVVVSIISPNAEKSEITFEDKIE